jgi:hypothetical protein
MAKSFHFKVDTLPVRFQWTNAINKAIQENQQQVT